MKKDKIKAIIIDDEPGGVDNIRYYINTYCPELEITRSTSEKHEVPELLAGNFDIAFLDIELFDDNIFNLLPPNPHFDIVFVTAYERYALQAFNVDVLDYMLKPLSQKGMEACYQKILRRFSALDDKDIKSLPIQEEATYKDDNLILRQGNNMYVTSYKDIVYLEANGIYTLIHFKHNGKKTTVTVSKPIGKLEETYIRHSFFRVHHSFLINTAGILKIKRKNGLEVVMSTEDHIPVAKRRASEFLSSIKV